MHLEYVLYPSNRKVRRIDRYINTQTLLGLQRGAVVQYGDEDQDVAGSKPNRLQL